MKYDREFHQTHQSREGIFSFITALARFAGLITIIGLGFITYLEWLLEYASSFCIYLTIVTDIVVYLESLWILDKFTTFCICCLCSETCFYWVCCFPINNWVKTIFYIVFSIPFLFPTLLTENIRTDMKIVGSLLIVTGILYFIKTFKYKMIDPDAVEDENQASSTTQHSISTQTTENYFSISNVNQEIQLKIEE